MKIIDDNSGAKNERLVVNSTIDRIYKSTQVESHSSISRCAGMHRDGILMVSCSAFYGVYMMSVVSVMFLYPSRNDDGMHRSCSLYTRVICVPSAFLRKL